MSFIPRIVLAVVVALLIGGGVMAYDRSHGAGWLVSPEQVEAAKASGKAGYEDGSGSVTVLPIRSETAGLLPFKWLLLGLGAGALCFVATRPRTGRR
jgi:hypothetical protein